MFDTPFIIPVVAIICWAVVSSVRAKNGIHPRGRHSKWGDEPTTVPPMFEKLVNKAMEERDQQLAILRERIEVLEKIVIDTHKTHALSEEIEKLRNHP